MKFINPYKMFNGAFIPNAIMRCKDLSQSSKLLWARLAQFAGEDGRCFPDIETLGSEIGIGRSAVKEAVRQLREFGLIFVKDEYRNGLQTSNSYHFLDHPVFHSCDGGRKTDHWGAENRLPGGRKTDCQGGGKPATEENQLRESEKISSSSGQENCPDGEEKKPKKYHGTAEDYALAQRIYKAVLVVNQTIKEPNFDRWANSIRLMREQDKRSHDEIWHVFDWANRDPFWSNNILSPDKLREKYPQLAAKAGMFRPVRRDSSSVGREAVDNRKCGACVWIGSGKWFCKAGADDRERCVAGCDSYRSRESAR